MERDRPFIESLRELPDEPVRQEGFLKRQVDEARGAARTAVGAWKGPDEDLAFNAIVFLLGVGDLAITPLIESGPPRDAARSAQYLNVLTNAELDLRQSLLGRIDEMLDDKRAVPPREPIDVPPEIKELPRRVCDEAYHAMRRLFHFGEELSGQLADKDAFLRLPDAKRDAAIEEARRTGSWRRAFHGGVDDDDGEA